ncbi:MAG TPA: hypothetical protein PLL10_10920, partial [Elusimicrobiales bacterium]|nr:hypothetical protein [Elusimicrobiales bacterium]
TAASPAKMKKLKGAIKAWTATVTAAQNEPAVIKAIQTALLSTPRYFPMDPNDSSNITSFMGDLGVFVMLVQQQLSPMKDGQKEPVPAATPTQQAIVDASTALLRTLLREVVLDYEQVGTDPTGIPYSGTTGLSVYLPPSLDLIDQTMVESAMAEQYANYAFAQESGWADFVSWLYKIRPAISIALMTQEPAPGGEEIQLPTPKPPEPKPTTRRR